MILRRLIDVMICGLVVVAGVLLITLVNIIRARVPAAALTVPTETVLSTITPAAATPAPTTDVVVAQANTCEDVLTRAMDTVQTSCSDLGRNKACYGNAQVQVEPNGKAVLNFDTVGDRAAVKDIRKLITSPLNAQTGTWGLSLLKIQANLPDTVPGQNVTFLVFGNTSIENTSGDMKAFYFSTTLGTLRCNEMPQDAIVVRSPDHMQVSFQANGVTITIASTIVMHAAPNRSMDVTLIEGHAQVATKQGSRTLKPGQSVTIPMGGPNGLQAVGVPSVAVKAPDDPSLPAVLDATKQIGDPDATLILLPDAADNMSIEGRVTAVRGNLITIGTYTINAGNNKALKAAKVGQYFQVTGTFSNSGNDREFILVKATSVPKVYAGTYPNAQSGNTGSVQGGKSSNSGNSADAGSNGNQGGNSADAGNNSNKGGNSASASNNGNNSGGNSGDNGKK